MASENESAQAEAVSRVLFTVLGGGLVLLLGGGALAWLIDSRLDSFEAEAAYRPPISDAADHVIDEALDDAPRQIEHEVFVPAYSHIYAKDGEAIRLAVTLSIRNTDAHSAITIHSVGYYNTEGRLVRSLVERPLKAGPHATKEFLVREDDNEGGSGANFIVHWSSAQAEINKPLIEAVMIGTLDQRGISFVSRGEEIRGSSQETRAEPERP